MKILEQNDRYMITIDYFESKPIILRKWKAGKLEVLFDDNLAQASGYTSTNEMIEDIIGLKKLLSVFGKVPTWIRMHEDGRYSFEDIPISNLN